MWIVRLALARPKSIAVMAILIFLLGALSVTQMAKDIFPYINLPVIAVIWSYGGVTAEEMDRRVVRTSESQIASSVANIEHIETQAFNGTGVIKVFFQPGTRISDAMAQISSTTQASIKSMPSGIQPPSILRYDASDVPIVQLVLRSDTEPITQVADMTSNIVIPQVITIQGAALSSVNGGAQRLINVDLDPKKMTAKGVTASDVTTAIGAQNLVLPAGDVKMGVRDYFVRLNNSPDAIDSFNDLPIKMVHGAMVYVRDVAHVRNGNAVQISMVRANGKPAVLITILKNGGASTIDVVDALRRRLPQIRTLLPSDFKLDLLLDQSVFVRAAVDEVVREAVMAAVLTAIMILLFLGSWRSTLTVAISIPLSILASVVALHFTGQTLNTLTLGGLALAVGMLVDDATVAVENTTRNLSDGLPLRRAILHSAEQVALPALTSTLSICIVFVPVAFLGGVARSLFLPLAMAVVFAMLPSYVLSRTLVTTMMDHMLGKEMDLYRPPPAGSVGETPSRRNIFWHLHEHVEVLFERGREDYRIALQWSLRHRTITVVILLVFFGVSAAMMPFIGEDFFPQVDAGQIRLHVRVAPGTRLEETGARFLEIEDTIRKVIPKNETALILDNLGLAGGNSFVRGNTGNIGAADGEIDISLTEDHHPSAMYSAALRKRLTRDYPDCTFFFQPPDISTQVLNFGTSAPIDVQILGTTENQDKDYALAQRLVERVARVPGAVDTYVYQVQNVPEVRVNVDRSRALQVGLTQSQVASNILVSLSSSSLVSPSFFLDMTNGYQYTVAAQTPQRKVRSMADLMHTPVSSVQPAMGRNQPELMANLATVARDTTPEVVCSYNILPSFDVYASVQNRDLGGVTGDIQRIMSDMQKHAPRGTRLVLSGQAATMQDAFIKLGFGLIFAILLIYLLLTVNFESWIDPLVIIMAAPGALSGVLWGLFLTQSTFNVPSLMGAIMSVGVATANSILLVTFANERRGHGLDAVEAALEAGYTRFRPVIMTALAMILGMLPMSLGLGAGGQQNAPLGRAVIGGLLVATCTTLFFVPIMYTVLRRRQPRTLKPLGEGLLSDGDHQSANGHIPSGRPVAKE